MRTSSLIPAILSALALTTAGGAAAPCALTPGDYTFPVPGWPGHDFDLHVPAGYDCAKPTPVLLAMHGGSGNSRSTARLSCPSEYLGLRRTPSDVGAPGCLNALADERRFAVVYPANQFATSGTCSPSRPVPILHMHGDQDPYWRYAGGANGKRGFDGEHISVCETLYGTAACPPEERTRGGPFTGWLTLNGCRARGTPEVWDPNPDDDSTTVWREDAVGCRAPIRLLRIEGGGHTWPGGWQYLPEDGFLGMLGVGVTSRELSANETMWAFLSAHSLP